jgi:hypothetical protein
MSDLLQVTEEPWMKSARLRAKVKQGGSVAFDPEFIGEGLNMTVPQVYKWFNDGRASSRIMEANMARVLGMRCTFDDGSFDLFTGPDKEHADQKWELRCITRNGARIAPSGMGGKRRKFNPTEFRAWLGILSGHIFCDVNQFPNVIYWIVPIEKVNFWVKHDKVSYKGTASRNQFSLLLEGFQKKSY